MCQLLIPRDTPLQGTILPLGYAVEDMDVVLLDEAGKEVAVGAVGEIAVRSRYLALEYWRQPELTQAAFLPDAKGGPERLYKTGDLGRLTADGLLFHLGRKDFQVKVRGFRVEVQEIESALLDHSAVQEVVVLARDNARGEQELVAYLTVRRSPVPESSTWRRHLRGRLPDHMVPALFVVLETMPLTASGKVDRLALPAPETSAPTPQDDAIPGTTVEKRLAQIWSELLDRQTIGRTDDFFDLGGHSLVATQVLSRVRDIFGVELTIAALFDYPTLAGFARHIEEGGRPCTRPAALPLARAAREGDLPLSFGQLSLWLLSQLNPNSKAYHIFRASPLKGVLDQTALEGSLNEILRRHEVLRTHFVVKDGQPVQVVHPKLTLELPVVDLRHLAPGAREEQVRALSTEEIARPFDLEKGPLLRVKLLRVRDAESLFLLTMHHIVTDGWSLGIFFRELTALYEAFGKGRPSPLPELPLQYADYTVWQRQCLAGEQLEEQLSYWKERLTGAPPVLELPTDDPRPAVQTFRDGRQSLTLPPPLADAISKLARLEGLTPFMVLLAAFQTLLHRQTGQSDIVTGTPTAGRNRTETEGLIGFFINTVVLRTDLSGNPAFREVLERVRRVCLGAFAHQDLPLERLVEELHPHRDPARSPLFQVFFNMLSFEDRPELDLETLRLSAGGSKFDLTLYVREQEQRTDLKLVYNADLFSAARMAELLAQYERLLEQLVKNPAQRIGDVSLVTPPAAGVLPNPAQPFQRVTGNSFLDLFSRQVRRVPEQTAVVDKTARWTYRELEAHSNRLANWLRAQGVRTEDVVAIYAHRSVALVWAMLGAWKAGAAFLILDPRYPATRLAERIHLAKPRAWLQLVEADTLPEPVEEAVLSCPSHLVLPPASHIEACKPLACFPAKAPKTSLGPNDLAYVVFTSGTTGAPKGILGTHGPLSHFFQWHGETFGLKATDRFSLLSGLGHDPLLRDVFTPLGLGATLCIPDPDEFALAGRLTASLARERITVAHLTPALGQWLGEGTSTKIDSLRYAFFGGDQLTRREIERFHELAPAAQCVNFYGTTETPQAMGYFVVPAASAAARDPLPIGQGIGGAQLLVLNAAGQLAGVGELGEIHIRTPYLTRGYLNDPALTQARFVINPATTDQGDRLYRTGDLGRYLPDGQVELAGRADQQVKLHGWRLELGEIEAALAKHPAIRQAVVVLRRDTLGDPRLVAYWVQQGQVTPPASELREFLAPQLPDYMRPGAFVLVPRVPLTPNGKVDRAALPNPDLCLSEAQRPVIVPPSLLEARLITLWEKVLGRSGIGVKDNFFELGGHSLLAVRLFSQIEEILSTRLPLATLLEAPTVESLAAVLRQRGWRCSSLIPIQPHGARPPLFCLHQLNGEVLCYRDLASHLGTNQPLYGLQARGLDGSSPPLVRVEEMASHYLNEMREFQPRGPYYLAGSSFGGLVAYEMACQLVEQGEEISLLALFDTNSRGYIPPALTACRQQLGTLQRRILFNLKQVLLGRKRLAFWREKGRSLSRRARRHLWRLAYAFMMRQGRSLPRALWNIAQANALAAQNYSPRPYPGRLTLFRASQQYIERVPEPTLGWGRLALGGVDTFEVPGGHATVIQDPHVALLAPLLQKCLDEAVAAKPCATEPLTDKGPPPVRAAA